MENLDFEKFKRDFKATPNDMIEDIENKLDDISKSDIPNTEKIKLLEKEKLKLIDLDDFCKKVFEIESGVVELSEEITTRLKEKSLFDTNTYFDYNLDIKNIITKYISVIDNCINELQNE